MTESQRVELDPSDRSARSTARGPRCRKALPRGRCERCGTTLSPEHGLLFEGLGLCFWCAYVEPQG